MSFDSLIQKIIATQNPSAVGLDPKLEYIPGYIKERAYQKHGKSLKAAGEAIYQYNKDIIDHIYDIVPAIKPQCAYYELYGVPGLEALYQTIAYAKQKGLYVIIDGKRNDIGSTMEAYAQAHLGLTEVEGELIAAFGGDALTVNGYLGSDGIEPLLKVCRRQDKGIFVLVKTSNPSSGEIQDQLIGGQPLYTHMGQMCEQWGKDSIGRFGYSCVGAVVGATYPKQMAELRSAMPSSMLLVPGYGAQGGSAADVAAAFDSRGLGAVINSSRAIMTAWKKSDLDPQDHGKAAREAALAMRADITAHLPRIGG